MFSHLLLRELPFVDAKRSPREVARGYAAAEAIREKLEERGWNCDQVSIRSHTEIWVAVNDSGVPASVAKAIADEYASFKLYDKSDDDDMWVGYSDETGLAQAIRDRFMEEQGWDRQQVSVDSSTPIWVTINDPAVPLEEVKAIAEEYDTAPATFTKDSLRGDHNYVWVRPGSSQVGQWPLTCSSAARFSSAEMRLRNVMEAV